MALFDAVTHGVTGEYSPFTTESSVPWLATLGTVVHVVGYLVFALVLRANAGSIDGGSRVVRRIRLPLFVALLVCGVGMLTAAVLPDAAGEAVGLVGTLSFLAMLVLGAALGIALLSTGRRTPGAWLLAGVLGSAVLTVVVGLLEPDWAHPAYAETALHFGLALLVLPQSRRDRA